MDKLFEVSVDYWVKFISDEPENIYNNQYNTPNTPDATRGCKSLYDKSQLNELEF